MGKSTEGMGQRLFYRLRTKITLPFAVLTLLVAGVGTFMVVRFTGVSLEERLTSYVMDAVDVTSQGVMRLQNDQLEALRAMAYTEGVPEAVADRDPVELANLLVPLKMNYGLDAVEVIDATGQEILGIHHDPNSARAEDFDLSQEVELSSWPIVGKLIAAKADKLGERHAEILPGVAGHVLWIGAPVKDGQNTVGCILTGAYLDNVAQELTEVAVARVSLYDGDGYGLASTFFHNPEEMSIPEELRGKLQAGPDSALLEPLEWQDRKYLVGYTPLIIRGSEVGMVSAAVGTEYISENNTRAGIGMIALFSAAGLAVLLLGYLIAGRMTTPLRNLVATSQQIASGDFTHRIQRTSSDEIGQLAEAFNFMAEELEKHTEQLSRRISELSVLYETSTDLNKTLDLAEILKVALDALEKSGEVSLVLLLLHREVDGDWAWAAARGLTGAQKRELFSKPLRSLPRSFVLGTGDDKPLIINGEEEVEILKGEIGVDVEVGSLMVVPLASPGRVIGVIVLGGTEKSSFSDDTQLRLLHTISTHIARSIHNARLYGQVRENVVRLGALLRASRSIGDRLSLNEVLEHIQSGVTEVCRAGKVAISLWDPLSKRLRLGGGDGIARGEVDSNWPGREMAARTVQDRHPVTTRNGKIVPISVGDGDSIIGERLCVPMLAEGQVLGAIFVEVAASDDGFLPNDLMALTTVANQAAVALKNAFLYEDIRDLYQNVVKSLAATIDAHDPYTHGHSHRVTANALTVAEYLGLDRTQRKALEVGAYLHDIGKIGVRDAILLKKGSLSADQRRVLEEHPVTGATILKPVGFDAEVISIVLSHHERVDGSGYPSGLKGDAIALGGRILCVADSFDAMVSSRPYRSALPVEAALGELRDGAGTQFDIQVVESFMEAWSDGRITLPGHPVDQGSEAGETVAVLREPA